MNDLLKPVLLAGLLVAGSALGADAPKVNVQLTMLTIVNPQGLALWDITNKSQDNDGNLDGKKLTAASWAHLLEIGKALEEGGRMLAGSSGIVAAAAGGKLQEEGHSGAPTAIDVQHHLDAKPAKFRQHARELQHTGAAIVAAVAAHDVKKLAALSDSLDEVCENCHKVFWYPEQGSGKAPKSHP